MTPKVSIITPMWKGAALVGATIESVLAQTFADWEMIIQRIFSLCVTSLCFSWR